MSINEIDAYINRHVAIAQAMGIHLKHSDANSVILAAPLAPNVNDKGTAFGGTLDSILFLSGWAMTYQILQAHEEQANIAIISSELSFLRPVCEEIVATCKRPEPELVEEFIRTYRLRKKARWTLTANIYADGEIAAKFKGRYAIYA